MDPRVIAHFGGDLSRANLSPRKRDSLLKQHGVVVPTASTDDSGGAAGDPGRASRGLAAAAAAEGDPAPGVRPTRRPSPEGTPAGPPAPTDEALVWRCPGCAYTYDVVAGEEREGFEAGTAWSEIPDSWCCPDCGVREKTDFVEVERAAAG
jgi:alkane 1-monooxygenase